MTLYEAVKTECNKHETFCGNGEYPCPLRGKTCGMPHGQDNEYYYNNYKDIWEVMINMGYDIGDGIPIRVDEAEINAVFGR